MYGRLEYTIEIWRQGRKRCRYGNGGYRQKYGGKAVLHPSQTLRGAGQAVKTATIGGAVGYVGWEKLTTDKAWCVS